MPRILHLIDSFEFGGAQRQLALLARELTRGGHDVHVGLVAGGAMLPDLQAGGAHVHHIPRAGSHDPRVLTRLRVLCRALRPDVVQTWLTYMDVLGGTAARMEGIPWVMTERSAAVAYPRSVNNWLRRRVAEGADAIVANSVAGQDYWHGRARRARRYVIRNGVPVDEIHSAAEAGAAARQRRVLFAGRLVWEKNLPTLLEALEVVLEPAGATAMLCGDGSELATLEARIRSGPLHARVEIAPFRADLWALMRASAVFASVSVVEGQPNTVLEAMACGCPLVVSNIPSHREFLDEASAWLVDPRDPAALAHALAVALQSPEEAGRRAARAREVVRRLSVAVAAEQYEGVYAEVRDYTSRRR